MKITREQLKQIVGEVMQEEQDYQQFFNTMLKKHGVESPAHFKSDQERKSFFDKVDGNWKGVHEKIKLVREKQAQKVEQLRMEEEQRAAELEEINNKINSAIEALESLRPEGSDYANPNKNMGSVDDTSAPSEYTNDGASQLREKNVIAPANVNKVANINKQSDINKKADVIAKSNVNK
jgi:DNA repair exonuclease SbcCD ATPase subunit